MRQESGRSMIEMIGVLAIMLALTAASVAMYNYATNMQHRSRVNDDVSNIVMGVRDLWRDHDDYSGVEDAGVFDAISVSNKNPYGGTYELAVNPSNPQQFIVRINGLTKSECSALTIRAWTDSVGYISSNHRETGASANCVDGNTNVVSIIYGDR